MHQNPFGGSALARPARGAYSAPPDLLDRFRGWGTPGKWLGREKRRREGRKRKGGEWREGRRGGRGSILAVLFPSSSPEHESRHYPANLWWR